MKTADVGSSPAPAVRISGGAIARVRAWLLADGGLPLVWLLLTVAVLVPVWSQRLLPMLDVPNRLALARGWHDFFDPAAGISRFYELRLRPIPYLLYYGIIHGLMYLVSIETAQKLVLSAYLIGFPLSVLALARALGRSPWMALGAFVLVFNPGWSHGFTAFLMGAALFFLALALLLEVLDGRRRRLWLSVTTVLLYLSHVLPWVAFGACALVLLAAHARARQRVAGVALALAPSVLLAVVALALDRAEGGYARGGALLVHRAGPGELALRFPAFVLEIVPGPVDMIALALLAATTGALALWAGTGAPAGHPLSRRRLLAVLGVLAVLYLCLPLQIVQPFSWWYVTQRVPVLMAPLLLLLPGAAPARWQRLALLPVIACALVLPLHLAGRYADFSRRNEGFLRLVVRCPRGAAVLVLARGMRVGPGSWEVSDDPATSGPAYWHWSSWPMALNGGYSPYLLEEGLPIRPKVRLPAPSLQQTDAATFADAPDYDYYLIRHATPAWRAEARLSRVDHDGDWTLFARAP